MIKNNNKIDESLNRNKAQIIPDTPEVKEGEEKAINDKDLNDEEKLHIVKLSEECIDAEHSLRNTEKLNRIYSQLITLFFGGWWFYIWVLFLFFLFVVNDDNFAKCYLNEFFFLLFKKFFYALGVVFVALLTFPTAKGLRRFFKSIIEILKYKAKKN